MMNKTVTIKLPDGSSVYKHVRAKDDAELQAKVQAIYAKLTKGRNIDSIIDEWEKYHFKQINANTQSCYTAPIKDIKEYFGSDYLSDIKPADVQRFILELQDERKYAKQTLKLRLIVLNLLYDYSILKGYCENNPCGAVKVPKNAPSTKRALPHTDAINAVKRAVNDDFGLLPFFLLYTGCRVGEALALQYSDIDFKNKVITINKTVVFVDGRPTIQAHTKTDAGNRQVPLLSPLSKALPHKKCGYVFHDENGEPLKKGVLYYQWRQYKKRVGVDISPHQLRHAYATILYDAGLPVKDSQLLLGHNSAEVTQNIYTHITEERKQKTFKRLEKYASK